MAGKYKERTGKVVSDKMDKTVVVEVEFATRHTLYQKTIRRSVRYKAHDEENKCKVDDLVRIKEMKPVSREKRWRVDEVIRKGEAVDVKPGEVASN